MMAPASPGHVQQHQQPISPPNRTSRDPPPRSDSTEIETHQQAHHLVLGMQLLEQSRAESRGQLQPDSHGPPTPIDHGVHSTHGTHGVHGAHPRRSPGILPVVSFANQLPPVEAGPMSIDWGLYGVHPNFQLDPTPFDSKDPGTMIPAVDDTIGHHSRPPHAPTDPAFAYGSELVSSSNLHSPRGHDDSGIPGHWTDTLNYGASTPKVTMPAGRVTNNPLAELDRPHEDNNPTSASRPKRAPQSRGQKNEARKTPGASQGGRSSADDSTPSVSDAASPSSASRNSRASISPKSMSMATMASITSSHQNRLRSASRRSKNSRDKPNDTPKERRTRASHNLVEKRYRNRLDAQFESLLNVLPEQARHGGNGNGDDNEFDGENVVDRHVSKGEVLEMARKHIQALELERNQLERDNLELQGRLRKLKEFASDGAVSSSDKEKSPDFNVNTDQEKVDDGLDQGWKPIKRSI